MKKVFLLGSRDPNGKNDITVMPPALKKRLSKAKVQTIYFEDLLFEIGPQDQRIVDLKTNADLREADLVIAFNWYKTGSKSIYRDLAYAVALYLKHSGRKFWNDEMIMQRSTTKLSALMLLSLNGFDVPKTYFSLSPEALISSSREYPAVLKAAAASRGHNNFLIKSKKELERYLEAQSHNYFLLQEFIPNDGDLRIICFDNKPKMVIQRRRDSGSTHLNNISAGARAELLDPAKLAPETISSCRKVCEIFGRNMAGIDLMVANDGSSRQVYLEVNAIPQLTSGSFIEDKLQSMAESIEEYLER